MEEKMQHAKRTFETLCQTLDSHEWHYKKDEEALRIECGAQGDDLPIEIIIDVDADRQLIVLLSPIPVLFSEEKRLDAAIATSVVNNHLVDGSFDFNVMDGHMFFRMTTSFLESDLSNDLFTYMLMCSCSTVDEYNDKFLMLQLGNLSVKDFIDEN